MENEKKQPASKKRSILIVSLIMSFFVLLLVAVWWSGSQIPTSEETTLIPRADLAPSLDSDLPVQIKTEKQAYHFDPDSVEKLKSCLMENSWPELKDIVQNWTPQLTLDDLSAELLKIFKSSEQHGTLIEKIDILKPDGTVQRLQLEYNDSENNYMPRMFQVDEDGELAPINLDVELRGLSTEDMIKKFSDSGPIQGLEKSVFYNLSDTRRLELITRNNRTLTIQLEINNRVTACTPQGLDPLADQIECQCALQPDEQL